MWWTRTRMGSAVLIVSSPTPAPPAPPTAAGRAPGRSAGLSRCARTGRTPRRRAAAPVLGSSCVPPGGPPAGGASRSGGLLLGQAQFEEVEAAEVIIEVESFRHPIQSLGALGLQHLARLAGEHHAPEAHGAQPLGAADVLADHAGRAGAVPLPDARLVAHL